MCNIWSISADNVSYMRHYGKLRRCDILIGEIVASTAGFLSSTQKLKDKKRLLTMIGAMYILSWETIRNSKPSRG